MKTSQQLGSAFELRRSVDGNGLRVFDGDLCRPLAFENHVWDSGCHDWHAVGSCVRRDGAVLSQSHDVILDLRGLLIPAVSGPLAKS